MNGRYSWRFIAPCGGSSVNGTRHKSLIFKGGHDPLPAPLDMGCRIFAMEHEYCVLRQKLYAWGRPRRWIFDMISGRRPKSRRRSREQMEWMAGETAGSSWERRPTLNLRLFKAT